MIVIPLDSLLCLKLAAIAFLFESLRILIAFFLGKPPDKIRVLTEQKAEAIAEVAQIKSVQLEFVRHSLLTRKIIKIEKEIETLQTNHSPQAQRIKNSFRIIRILFYIGIGAYYYNSKLLMVNPMLLWPLSWFTSKPLINVQAWFILFVCGLSFRHVLRTFLSVTFRKSIFP